MWKVLWIPKAWDAGGATCAMPLNAKCASYIWKVSNPKSEQQWVVISSVRQNPLWKVAAGRKTDNMQRWNAFHLCFWTGCFPPSLIFFFLRNAALTVEYLLWIWRKQIKSRSELAGLMPLLSCVVMHRADLFVKAVDDFLSHPSIQRRQQFPGVAGVFAIQLWEQ